MRWNPSLSQPHVQGFRRFVILLPDPRRYTESEVEKMLFHELTHCRSRDTRMKHYLAILTCIHWWNPIFHGMIRKRKTLAGAVALLVVLTTTTVWAAGEAAQMGYNRLYQSTQVAIQEVYTEASQVEYIEPVDANPAVRVVGSDISWQASSSNYTHQEERLGFP